MALHWFATAPIHFDLVRAFNIGDQVPDSVISAHPAETTGRVIQIDVPAQNPATVLRPLLTSDRDTDGEREAFVPARLSDANLRATSVAAIVAAEGLANGRVVTADSTATGGLRWGTSHESVARALGWVIVTDAAYGATGDGATDDTAAIQEALDAVPANGGCVYFPPGVYRVTSTLTSSRRGLLLRGAGGLAFNESDAQGSGSSLVGDAGVAIFAFNGAATSLIHQGPAIERLNFREKGLPKTAAYLVKIGAANRWSVRDCSFSGGAVGLSVNAGTPALDVSWGIVDHAIFRSCTIGLDFPTGTGTTLVNGGEFTGTGTGIRLLPLNSLTSELTVIGAKFDAATVAGIRAKGRNLRVYGSGFERCAVGVLIERDAALHVDSGKYNKIRDCLFIGSGTEVGVSIGTGCTGTVVDAEYSNLATRVADSGSGTTRIDESTGQKMDKAASQAPFHQFSVNGATISDFFSDSASALMWRALVSGTKLRVRLAGVTSSDEWAVQTNAGANLLRVFGNGVVNVPGALDHDGATAGFYGATPVTKAANPGTATGTDATVINNIVAALRNLGLVV